MTTIRVNGETRIIESEMTVSALITSLLLQPEGLAVVVNNEIISRNRFPEHILVDGDRVDMVRAVAGG